MNFDWELVTNEESEPEENGKIYIDDDDNDNDDYIVNQILMQKLNSTSLSFGQISIDDIVVSPDIIEELNEKTVLNNIEKSEDAIKSNKDTDVPKLSYIKLVKKIPNSIWLNLAFYLLKNTNSYYYDWRITMTYSFVSTMVLCLRNKHLVYRISKYSLLNTVPYFFKKK